MTGSSRRRRAERAGRFIRRKVASMLPPIATDRAQSTRWSKTMAMLVNRQGSFLPGLLIVSLIMSTTPLLNGCSRNPDEPEASAATSPPLAAGEAPLPAAAASPTAALAPPPINPAAEQPGPPPSAATAAQLQEMVAPIVLYPDML